MVSEAFDWNLHRIVSHAKMVAQQLCQSKRLELIGFHFKSNVITTASSRGSE